MANLKSSKKDIRRIKRRTARNLARKIAIDKLVRKFRKLIKAKNLDEAKSLIPQIYKALDKAAQRNVIKKKTAARKKSRLMKLLLSTSSE
uniref:Small ribosomal subunit protein bS20 n=1 Tax=candidate division CPR3 bacterium TaxID=2268181 RepID=A0A7C5UVP3_UNCC3